MRFILLVMTPLNSGDCNWNKELLTVKNFSVLPRELFRNTDDIIWASSYSVAFSVTFSNVMILYLSVVSSKLHFFFLYIVVFSQNRKAIYFQPFRWIVIYNQDRKWNNSKVSAKSMLVCIFIHEYVEGISFLICRAYIVKLHRQVLIPVF